MSVLLADVGGTNSRLALAGPEGPEAASIARFRNDAHGAFDEVLDAYLAAHPGRQVSAACVAVAGPVLGTAARLTNRDWTFRCEALAARLGGARVVLINDLAALALALPHVRPAALCGTPAPAPQTAGQAVVVGMGTGFNAALRHGTPAGAWVLAVEFGHASPPVTVADEIEATLGPGAARHFATNEQIFAGPGLARFCAMATGQELTPEAILTGAAADPDGLLGRAVAGYARALGRLAAEILDIYMPDRGIVLAGSVARGLMGGPALGAFLDGYTAAQTVGLDPASVPVGLITEDTAALWGCHARLAQDCPDARCLTGS